MPWNSFKIIPGGHEAGHWQSEDSHPRCNEVHLFRYVQRPARVRDAISVWQFLSSVKGGLWHPYSCNFFPSSLTVKPQHTQLHIQKPSKPTYSTPLKASRLCGLRV